MKYSYKFEEDPFGDLEIVLSEEISIFSDFIENIATEEQANEYIVTLRRFQKGYMKILRLS